MTDTFEVEISEYKEGSAHVFKLDTEYEVKSCFLTKKYEAKIITASGMTEITKPLVVGTFVALIFKDTRFSYKVVFMPSDKREDIQVK